MACRFFLMVFTCVLKWTNTVRCHCTWRPPRRFFWQKSCVCLSSRSQIMQRFSIQSVKKGSLLVHWSVSFHADKIGWQQSLWEHYRNLCVHREPFPLLQSNSGIVFSMFSMHWCFFMCMYIYITSGCIMVWLYFHSSMQKVGVWIEFPARNRGNNWKREERF